MKYKSATQQLMIRITKAGNIIIILARKNNPPIEIGGNN